MYGDRSPVTNLNGKMRHTGDSRRPFNSIPDHMTSESVVLTAIQLAIPLIAIQRTRVVSRHEL